MKIRIKDVVRNIMEEAEQYDVGLLTKAEWLAHLTDHLLAILTYRKQSEMFQPHECSQLVELHGNVAKAALSFAVPVSVKKKDRLFESACLTVSDLIKQALANW